MHDSVTVHMAAPPERVWDLVSDVTRIGRYSPETFEAEWIEGATGPAVGAELPGPREAQREGAHLLDDVHRDGVRARQDVRLRGGSGGQATRSTSGATRSRRRATAAT